MSDGSLLMDCPACGRRVSREAKACPDCAHPIAAQNEGATRDRAPLGAAALRRDTRTAPSRIATTLLSLSGRTDRARFLAVYLTCVLYWWLVPLAAAVGEGLDLLALVLLPLVLWVQLRVAAKRFHDLDESAWFLLSLLVPVWNFVQLVRFAVQPGSSAENRFGPPLEPAPAARIWAFSAFSLMVVGAIVALSPSLNGVKPSSNQSDSAAASQGRGPVASTSTSMASPTTVGSPEPTGVGIVSQVRPPSAPSLSPQGIGSAILGSDADTALARLVEYFGRPTFDSGWSPPTWEAGLLWCFDVDLERAVGWDDPDLLVLFAQGPGIEGLGSGFVYFWHSNEVPGAGVRLTTVSGLRPADNLTDIAMSYGTSEVRDWEGSLNGYVLLEGSDDWGMKAWLDTDLSIYGIDAGATCAD